MITKQEQVAILRENIRACEQHIYNSEIQVKISSRFPDDPEEKNLADNAKKIIGKYLKKIDWYNEILKSLESVEG